jgi:hypothetical protein
MSTLLIIAEVFIFTKSTRTLGSCCASESRYCGRFFVFLRRNRLCTRPSIEAFIFIWGKNFLIGFDAGCALESGYGFARYAW